MWGFRRGLVELATALALLPTINAAAEAYAEERFPLPPSILLIWDTPVDLEHAYIQEAINHEAMDGIKLQINGETHSLRELNQTEMNGQARSVLGGAGCLHDRTQCRTSDFESYQIDFAMMSSVSRPVGLENLLDKLTGSARAFFLGSERYRNLSSFAHGTAITGVAASGLPAESIITLPTSFAYTDLNLQVGLTTDEFKIAYTKYQDQLFGALAETIERSRVRVVNWSGAFSLETIKTMLNSLPKTSNVDRSEKMARELLQIPMNRVAEIYASFPEVLFVVSAGNDFGKTNLLTMSTASLRAPNLIFATNSSFYANAVDEIAIDHVKMRPGTAVTSVPAGLYSYMEGTSISAPKVANEAASLIINRPELTVAELIRVLSN